MGKRFVPKNRNEALRGKKAIGGGRRALGTRVGRMVDFMAGLFGTLDFFPHQQQRVLKLAGLSRAVLIALSILWLILGRPYDTSAMLNPPCLSAEPQRPSVDPSEVGSLAELIGRTIEKSVVWDGVYYLRIAQCGYEYEQTFAFLPILPLCMRLVADNVFFRLVPVLGYRATLALSGYVLNNIAFIYAALYFYKVTIFVLKDEKLAYLATALFCLNPASIFYSSIYSESLFSLLSFAGMWQLLSGSSWKAAALFAISSCVRSNGVLHAGYFLFQAMHGTYAAFFHCRRPLMAVQILSTAALQTTCVFTPFVAFQAYGYIVLCNDTSAGGLKDSRPWCKETIPYLYGFVQSNYWDVGFLRYFQLKQLPNFLLASPMLALAVGSFVTYTKHKPGLLFSFGLCANAGMITSHSCAKDGNIDKTPLEGDKRHLTTSSVSPLGAANKTLWHRKGLSYSKATGPNVVGSDDAADQSFTQAEGFFSVDIIPFVGEMAFMVFVASFIMHVQVATRFLSVCPPVYWFAAYVMEFSAVRHWLGHFIWAVSLTYLSLGSLLFVNFYPFT